MDVIKLSTKEPQRNSFRSGKFKNITQHEIEALKHDFNMSDAHTHQDQSASQKKIIEHLPELWFEAEQSRQYDTEQKFIKNFFTIQKKEAALKNNNSLLTYASSISMVVTANYLMKKNMGVSLMHPCFDNITDILKNMEIPMEPLEESWFYDADIVYETLSKNVQADALFIVDPNNPTGFTLFKDKKIWEETVRYAKDHNKLLLIDFCFSSFLRSDKRLAYFDVYELLESSGVSYVAYEDTGKTWPLQDTKVSILKTSADIYSDIYDIHTSYLLNVSPFVLNVVNEYLLDSKKDDFKSVFALLDSNRKLATEILKNSILEPIISTVNLSVLWCRILDPKIKASELKEYLADNGVHVLPGTYFYWNDLTEGEKYIRIAMARNTDIIERAMKKLRILLDEYKRNG